MAGISVIFIAGYLLIYNVFYISIAQDIRFYGMLKTLGTTARQDVYKRQDYSGWRCPDGSSTTLPLWIEASDPSHGRKFIFTQKGPALQTTIRYADGTEKQRIYRRKEDMAAELMTMFQEELRVYPPWSENRRKRYEYERQ